MNRILIAVFVAAFGMATEIFDQRTAFAQYLELAQQAPQQIPQQTPQQTSQSGQENSGIAAPANVRRVSLRKLLAALSEKHHAMFNYNVELVKNIDFTPEVADSMLAASSKSEAESRLNTALEPSDLRCKKLDENTYVIQSRSKKAEGAESDAIANSASTLAPTSPEAPSAIQVQSQTVPLAQNGTISGIVSEAKSGEAVIGVTVIVSSDSTNFSKAALVRGTRTNKFGFYSLPNVPSGTYYITVRGLGYASYLQSVRVEDTVKSVRVNIPLRSQDIKSETVTVQGERSNTPTNRAISAVQLQSELVSKMPTLGGEADIFRTLQLMPGIKPGTELSNGIYVRGGSPDQNLILLDGVTVYNPAHLAGLFTVFNNDAIRDVRVIKGAFPAEYGGRLSSVIDLTMKEGSKEKIGGTANLSLVASRLTLEGPITENMSFMVSGRRTYLDLLLNLFLSETAKLTAPNYNFYDFNAKLNYKISDNDHLYLAGYFGNDFLSQKAGQIDFSLIWGNATGNLRWMHIISPNLFTNFSAIYSNYRYNYNEVSRTGQGLSKSVSNIQDYTLRGDLQYFPSPEHSIKAGIDATMHRFTVANVTDERTVDEFIRNISPDDNADALEASIYAQDEWQITPQLSANIGFRLAYFQRGNYVLPEPRLSLTYEVSDALTLKGAAAMTNQFLHLLVRNDITFPSDTWFPAGEVIKPANAMQYVLGAETKLFGDEYVFSIEGYYKTMNNLYEFREDVVPSLVINDVSSLTAGKGESYGVEFFLNKRMGAFTGWLGYTLSWTTRTFAELNGGKPFFPRYDRRHDISIVLNYKFSDAWELGASWVFGTGQAFSLPTSQFFFPSNPATGALVVTQDRGVPANAFRTNYTERNGFRLPDYHRLDLNFTHYFSWFGLPFNASINVINAYNRANPFFFSVSFDANSATKPTAIVQQAALFPIIPTIALGFKF
ncbi:MAG: TonB-dependent receptor [Candidatus Kapaibacteriota bacterium]